MILSDFVFFVTIHKCIFKFKCFMSFFEYICILIQSVTNIISSCYRFHQISIIFFYIRNLNLCLFNRLWLWLCFFCCRLLFLYCRLLLFFLLLRGFFFSCWHFLLLLWCSRCCFLLLRFNRFFHRIYHSKSLLSQTERPSQMIIQLRLLFSNSLAYKVLLYYSYRYNPFIIRI